MSVAARATTVQPLSTICSDEKINFDPSQPDVDIKPFKTIAAAKNALDALGAGPDWLLLKQGDVWFESFGQWSKSGSGSGDLRQVISSYGDHPQRPALHTGSNGCLSATSSSTELKHVIFEGFFCYAHTQDPFSPDYSGETEFDNAGFDIYLNSGENILIENTEVAFYKSGVVIQGANRDRSHLGNIFFRGNVVHFTTGVGMYLNFLFGTLELTGNIF